MHHDNREVQCFFLHFRRQSAYIEWASVYLPPQNSWSQISLASYHIINNTTRKAVTSNSSSFVDLSCMTITMHEFSLHKFAVSEPCIRAETRNYISIFRFIDSNVVFNSLFRHYRSSVDKVMPLFNISFVDYFCWGRPCVL